MDKAGRNNDREGSVFFVEEEKEENRSLESKQEM